MTDSVTEVEERALALRAEALEICDRFAWTPQCIGRGDFQVGAWEIYEELRRLQKVRAVYVSQALIECCLRHQQWLPLFEDVEARIWLFLGEWERAEQRWQAMLHHSSLVMREIAEKALNDLKLERESGLKLATEVVQALDRSEIDLVYQLLIEALLHGKSSSESDLQSALEAVAIKIGVPDGYPWNPRLFVRQLKLDSFQKYLNEVEKKLGV